MTHVKAGQVWVDHQKNHMLLIINAGNPEHGHGQMVTIKNLYTRKRDKLSHYELWSSSNGRYTLTKERG